MPIPHPDVDPARLRNLFTDSGYDQTSFWTRGLREAIARRGGTAYLDERTRDFSKVNVLYRLFMVGMPVPRTVAEEFLSHETLGELSACGLIAVDEDCLQARVMVSRVHDHLFAAD